MNTIPSKATFILSFMSLVFIGLTFSKTTAAADYYRWKDAKGNQVNSDRPPPAGIDYEVIGNGRRHSVLFGPKRGLEETNTVPPPAPDSTDTPDQNTGQTAGIGPNDQIEIVDKSPELCQQAKGNLEAINSSARIRIRGEDGQLRFLSQPEVEEQKAQAKQTIERNCE